MRQKTVYQILIGLLVAAWLMPPAGLAMAKPAVNVSNPLPLHVSAPGIASVMQPQTAPAQIRVSSSPAASTINLTGAICAAQAPGVLNLNLPANCFTWVAAPAVAAVSLRVQPLASAAITIVVSAPAGSSLNAAFSSLPLAPSLPLLAVSFAVATMFWETKKKTPAAAQSFILPNNMVMAVALPRLEVLRC